MVRPEYQPLDDEKPLESYHQQIPQRWAYLFPDLFQNEKAAFCHLQNALNASGEHKIEVEKNRNGWSVRKHEFVKKPDAVMGSELSRYEEKHLINNCVKSDSVSVKERKMMLAVILAMAVDKYGYEPNASRSPATGKVRGSVEKIGISVSDDTIKKYLKEAFEYHRFSFDAD